jgi:hypothetical protein
VSPTHRRRCPLTDRCWPSPPPCHHAHSSVASCRHRCPCVCVRVRACACRRVECDGRQQHLGPGSWLGCSAGRSVRIRVQLLLVRLRRRPEGRQGQERERVARQGSRIHEYAATTGDKFLRDHVRIETRHHPDRAIAAPSASSANSLLFTLSHRVASHTNKSAHFTFPCSLPQRPTARRARAATRDSKTAELRKKGS